MAYLNPGFFELAAIATIWQKKCRFANWLRKLALRKLAKHSWCKDIETSTQQYITSPRNQQKMEKESEYSLEHQKNAVRAPITRNKLLLKRHENGSAPVTEARAGNVKERMEKDQMLFTAIEHAIYHVPRAGNEVEETEPHEAGVVIASQPPPPSAPPPPLMSSTGVIHSSIDTTRQAHSGFLLFEMDAGRAACGAAGGAAGGAADGAAGVASSSAANDSAGHASPLILPTYKKQLSEMAKDQRLQDERTKHQEHLSKMAVWNAAIQSARTERGAEEFEKSGAGHVTKEVWEQVTGKLKFFCQCAGQPKTVASINSSSCLRTGIMWTCPGCTKICENRNRTEIFILVLGSNMLSEEVWNQQINNINYHCSYCVRSGMNVLHKMVINISNDKDETKIIWRCPTCKQQCINRAKQAELAKSLYLYMQEQKLVK